MTLSLNWMLDSDQLALMVNPLDNRMISKRTILYQIAQFFDPLGLVVILTFCAKMIVQEL